MSIAVLDAERNIFPVMQETVVALKRVLKSGSTRLVTSCLVCSRIRLIVLDYFKKATDPTFFRRNIFTLLLNSLIAFRLTKMRAYKALEFTLIN